jgi:hypothetical protein
MRFGLTARLHAEARSILRRLAQDDCLALHPDIFVVATLPFPGALVVVAGLLLQPRVLPTPDLPRGQRNRRLCI